MGSFCPLQHVQGCINSWIVTVSFSSLNAQRRHCPVVGLVKVSVVREGKVSEAVVCSHGDGSIMSLPGSGRQGAWSPCLSPGHMILCLHIDREAVEAMRIQPASVPPVPDKKPLSLRAPLGLWCLHS